MSHNIIVWHCSLGDEVLLSISSIEYELVFYKTVKKENRIAILAHKYVCLVHIVYAKIDVYELG